MKTINITPIHDSDNSYVKDVEFSLFDDKIIMELSGDRQIHFDKSDLVWLLEIFKIKTDEE